MNETGLNQSDLQDLAALGMMNNSDMNRLAKDITPGSGNAIPIRPVNIQQMITSVRQGANPASSPPPQQISPDLPGPQQTSPVPVNPTISEIVQKLDAILEIVKSLQTRKYNKKIINETPAA